MRSQVRVARALHLVSAFWTLGLALLIAADVVGRAFLMPVPGTKEIVQNSVVTIVFLQLPLAIYSGAMLRTPILIDALPPVLRRLVNTFGMLLGCAFLLGLLWGTWPSFVDAYRIGEYEGEGSLRVPTWPVRGAIAAMSVFGVVAYAWMIWLDWTGGMVDDHAPGAIPRLDA